MYLNIETVLNGSDKRLKNLKDCKLFICGDVKIDRTALNMNIVLLPVYSMICLAANCLAIGNPFCVNHTIEFYGIFTKQTSLNFAFQGLFASRDFETNEKIVPYFHLCLFMPTCECSIVIPDPYSIVINNKTHSALQCRYIGAFANTILKKSRTDNLGRKVATSDKHACNAKFVGTDLVAIKPIKNGQEIFAYYGSRRFEYMDVSIAYFGK